MKKTQVDLTAMIDQEALKNVIVDLENELAVRKKEVTEIRRKLKNFKEFLKEENS